MDVVWLTKETVIEIHDECISEYTPDEPAHILSINLLESALARGPNKRYYNQNSDIFDIVAAVSAGINRNHSFANANKRTAFYCAVVMLHLNGYLFYGEMNDAIHVMTSLARGGSENDLAEWLRAESVLIEKSLA